jgi:hypothetical protein
MISRMARCAARRGRWASPASRCEAGFEGLKSIARLAAAMSHASCRDDPPDGPDGVVSIGAVAGAGDPVR